jgi:hypothetical protein
VIEQLLKPNSAHSISIKYSAIQTNQTTKALIISGWGYLWTQDGEN